MMEYKGYTATVEYDDDADVFHGQVLNLRDVITFQGTSVAELKNEFANSVEDYLEFCRLRGEEPEKALSGRFLVRVDPDLHRMLAAAASRQGISLNAWVSKALQRSVQPDQSGVESTGSRPESQRGFAWQDQSILAGSRFGSRVSEPEGFSWETQSYTRSTRHIGGEPAQSVKFEPRTRNVS